MEKLISESTVKDFDPLEYVLVRLETSRIFDIFKIQMLDIIKTNVMRFGSTAQLINEV